MLGCKGLKNHETFGIYVFNSVVNTKLPAIDKQSNFTCTKKLFKRDWFEQSLMTDFIMFSLKSEKNIL